MVKKALEKILVSACLLGNNVRYNGSHCLQTNPYFEKWLAENRFIRICPEVSGGLSIPRPPAEIEHGDSQSFWHNQAKVLTKQGQDVSPFFKKGAHSALALARQHHIKMAILKEKSPSCGVANTYDGQFNGRLTKGFGITAAYLHHHGIAVFSEHMLDQAARFLDTLEEVAEFG